MTSAPSNWDPPAAAVGSTPAETGYVPPEWTWARYHAGRRLPSPDLESAVASARAGDGYLWLGLHNPSQQTMSRFGEHLGLHELAIEDAVHGHRRSKLERFDEHLFFVVSTVAYQERDADAPPEIVTTGELMVFLGDWFVMTSRHSGPSRMPEVRALVEQESDDMPRGPSRVLYACLSVAIDDFERVAEQMEDDVEDCEQLIFGDRREPDLERTYQIKRELIEFRRRVVPLCAPLTALYTRDFGRIHANAKPYFRELADRVQAVRETVVALEDQLSNIMQTALARAGFDDNRDMRKISSAVAIVAVPTTLGAIYGMNFDNIPELHWGQGYYVVMAMNVIGMTVLYFLFRKFKWL
ncbi:MAG: magnesium and cobalt transport protein CorA [Micropruina sp.]|uniref:magnesium and cobalt transport protein CorA n=1 Tax=Micropruina sp. TaxID=2737536 RepID=UPI0039E37485